MHTRHSVAVAVLAGWLLATLPRPVGAQWVTFPSAPGDALVHSGEPATGSGFLSVRGYLSVPVKPGPHPAVVMLPSCLGRRAYHQSWADALSERGYVALVVDDYFMRDLDRSCGIGGPSARTDLLRMRLLHALGAARYLSERPEVDHARMAVMGWGDAPVGALVGDLEDVGPRREVFNAAVAVTPTICRRHRRPSPSPMLVIVAGSDGTGPGDPCDARTDEPALEVHVYEGTLPGFDDPQAAVAVDSASPSAGTAPRRYDRLAHVRALDDVMAFLDRRLPPGPSEGAHTYAASPAAAVPEVGTWVVDPNAPGPDLPPVGESLFDAVFSRAAADGVVHDVPFPFPRLLEVLEHAAGGKAMSRSPLDATLIPLGRSLQREAAAPDYFRSPRIVVAVTGGPESGTGPLGIRLENRLFLGYQPRTQVLEVISYNEVANRFEFQIVRDYGPDAEPRVRYARRALCTSCHQNAAPIFADAGWDETTANPRVASRLDDLGTRFHGIPVTESDRAVTAIDAATDEANLLPVYQRLWSEGCAATEQSEVARCRAGALQAMVQYRLSNSAGFDRATVLYADGYLPLQRRNWAARWSQGLLIPSPNLPNRAPLMSPSPSLVSVALDPLRRRPPLARWEGSSDRDLDRLVRGLSHALPDRHVALLDRYLRDAGDSAPDRSSTAPCEVVRRGLAGRPRLLQIECGAEPEMGAGFRLRAQLRVTPDGSAEGEAAWIEIGTGAYARRIMVGHAEDSRSRRLLALRVVGNDGETAIRAPDGNSILGFDLAWDEGAASATARFQAMGRIHVADDFRPVASTFERLAADTTPSSPLLAERFDGAGLTERLLAELGVLAASECCKSRPTPAALVDVEAGSAEAALSVALEHRGPLLTFRRYCGACHGSDSSYPPGFLHSDGEALLSSVAQCAQRIYYRLSMWQRRAESQTVPPMPPAQGLSLAGTTPREWRRSESLERLTDYARKLLTEEGRDPGAVLEGDYHATRPCLAGRGGPLQTVSED